MLCLKCRHINTRENKFCANCGKELSAESDYEMVFIKVLRKIKQVDPIMMSARGWIFEGKEAEIIPSIVQQIASNHVFLKYLIYFGYIVRREESNFFNKTVESKKYANLVRGSLDSDVIKIANELDTSNTVGFGEAIAPFLIMDRGYLENIMKMIYESFSRVNPEINEINSEILLRNLHWGYCLAVSWEIVNSIPHKS